jgi:hypothetical protein
MAEQANLRAYRSVKNLISESNSRFISSFGNWEITNGTATIEASDIIDPYYRSVRVAPLVESMPVEFTLRGVLLEEIYNGSALQFHARVKSFSSCVTDVILTRNDGFSVKTSNITNLSLWNVVRSATLPTPNDTERVLVDITVSVCQHRMRDVLFTVPFLYLANGMFTNRFLFESFLKMPFYMRELDSEQEENYGLPSWPLARFMDLPTGIVGRIIQEYWAFKYLDIAEGKDPNNPGTLSELVDEDVARERFLLWLAQFVGAILKVPPKNPTVWGRLPQNWLEMQQEIDPTVNAVYIPESLERSGGVVTAVLAAESQENNSAVGSWVSVRGSSALGLSFDGGFRVIYSEGNELRWMQDGPDENAATLGTITALDSEWIEVENYDRLRTDLQDILRWQVKFAYNGINGGTLEALENSVKRELTGDKFVNIRYRVQNNPWFIIVETKQTETPTGVTNEMLLDPQEVSGEVGGLSSPTINAYIRGVKPIGYDIQHVILLDQ